MEQPLEVIRRRSEEHQVEPAEMLVHLLDSLWRRCGLLAIQPSNNALAEIYSVMQLSGKSEFPKSVLEVLGIGLQLEEWLDTANAENLRVNHNRPNEAEILERKARAEKALRLVLQDLSESAEQKTKKIFAELKRREEAGEIVLSPGLASTTELPVTENKQQPDRSAPK
jgi:hypothetical protein